MIPIFRDPSLRGTRRTRPYAVGLAATAAAGLVVLAGLTLWGLVRGPRSADRIELMNIDAPADAVVLDSRVAPSRPAPAMIPNVALTLQDPAQVPAVEQQLLEATADAGPALGSPRVAPDPPTLTPTFDGRPLRAVKTVRMLTTAYSPDEQSCGIYADGITASGYSVWTNGMKLVAADTDHYPFGTILTIPGYNGGRPVPVLDRGGRIKGHRLDVLYPTHERALQWGVQRLDVTVWEYAD